jgi:hypothetical protein
VNNVGVFGGSRVRSSQDLTPQPVGASAEPITINFNPTITAPVDPRGTREFLEDSYEELAKAMEKVIRRQGRI